MIAQFFSESFSPCRSWRIWRLNRQRIQPGKIVFSNFHGSGYGCNPKYITEEILRRHLPWDIVWLVDKTQPILTAAFPQGVRRVAYRSARALYELASAKIWINNIRSNRFFYRGLTKKEGQYYIQTWHGSFGIKKIDAAAGNSFTSEQWIETAKLDSACTDYLLSNGSFETWVFSSSFWYDGKILECGHPRNDIFFADMTEVRARVASYLNLGRDTRYALYAPSFRDDRRLYPYHLDVESLAAILEQRFGGEWRVVVRLHPHLKPFHDKLFPPSKRVLAASLYDDVQELLACADVTVTDYSSCIFDFLLTGRPGFIFAPDGWEFNTMRGFYYPLEETPFPIAATNRELHRNILAFDADRYREKAAAFLLGKGSLEDGLASRRVVDLLQTIVEGSPRA